MTHALLVFCSCADETEAARIGRAAVEARLAACATVGATVQSTYVWNGKLESARETMLLLKTTTAAFPALEEMVRSMHSYETPEILAVPVAAGSLGYLSWLTASVVAESSASSPKDSASAVE